MAPAGLFCVCLQREGQARGSGVCKETGFALNVGFEITDRLKLLLGSCWIDLLEIQGVPS